MMMLEGTAGDETYQQTLHVAEAVPRLLALLQVGLDAAARMST
jgi:hypothetical protein